MCHLFVYLSDVVKYVNTHSPESYSVPTPSEPIPKYLEIIYDENDDRPLPVNPYEIPLPPLDEVEIVHTSSPTSSIKSINKSSESETNQNTSETKDNCIKGRTISSASTVSETSVYNPSKMSKLSNMSDESDLSKSNCNSTVTLPNTRENCPSNDKVCLSQQQLPYAHTKKIQQMYANTNMETAIRTCDGITSM